MTVKELKEELEHAYDENAEVIITTAHGDFSIMTATGHYQNEPFLITCESVW